MYLYLRNSGFGELTKGNRKTYRRIKKGDKETGSIIGKIKVVIDSRTTIYIDDESKIKEVRKKYKDLEKTNSLRLLR